MSAPFPIPKGLHRSAQGCPVGGTTLGDVCKYFPQPQRGCIIPRRADGRNPFRVVEFSGCFPRVARSSQPWAEGRSPFGAEESRTLAALRDALLPKLLSGELRVPGA